MREQQAGRILVIDDERSARRGMYRDLQEMGFAVDMATGADTAAGLVRIEQYDCLLLAVPPPGIEGLEVCREIREQFPSLGILILTVGDTEDVKVAAFDAGADDCINMPFRLREMAARIRAVVRRASVSRAEPQGVIRIGELELDPERRLLRKSGAAVRLTPKEFDLLHYLMAHAGMPMGHARLLHAVWGAEYGGELEYLRTFVRQLRKKIEDDPAEPAYLTTDCHIGYRFAEARLETAAPRIPAAAR